MVARTHDPELFGHLQFDFNLSRQFPVLKTHELGTQDIVSFARHVARFNVSTLQEWHGQLRSFVQTVESHSICVVGIAPCMQLAQSDGNVGELFRHLFHASYSLGQSWVSVAVVHLLASNLASAGLVVEDRRNRAAATAKSEM